MAPHGELVVDREAEVWILALRGEHDLTTQETLRAEVEAAFASGSSVVFDLSESTFIDSTVLRVLVTAKSLCSREQDQLAVVAPAGSFPRRVLELAQVDYVTVYEDREAALAALA